MAARAAVEQHGIGWLQASLQDARQGEGVPSTVPEVRARPQQSRPPERFSPEVTPMARQCFRGERLPQWSSRWGGILLRAEAQQIGRQWLCFLPHLHSDKRQCAAASPGDVIVGVGEVRSGELLEWELPRPRMCQAPGVACTYTEERGQFRSILFCAAAACWKAAGGPICR